MDTEQFGRQDQGEPFPRLRSAYSAGRDLAALVRGFAVASLGVQASILAPVRKDLTAFGSGGLGSKRRETGTSKQSTLRLDASDDPRGS